MTSARLSIVIPTRDKVRSLRLVLDCLRRQSGSRPFEVVVVDDGSTDATAAALAAATAVDIAVQLGGRGRAAARNAGARAATGDRLVFLDDDVVVGERFVEGHDVAGRIVHGPLVELPAAARFLDGLDGAAQDEVVRSCNDLLEGATYRTFANALERAIEATNRSAEPVAPWLGFVGANVSIDRPAFERLGGFDETFGTRWGCEDLELGYRAHAAGIEFGSSVAARGVHLTHTTPTRWDDHAITLARFAELHDDPAVRALGSLLAPDGSVERFLDEIDAG